MEGGPEARQQGAGTGRTCRALSPDVKASRAFPCDCERDRMAHALKINRSAEQPMPSDQPHLPPLRFVQRGSIVQVEHVAPDRTLLALLREDLGQSAVKEGCNSGNCGACSVVLAQARGDGLRWRAVNSCLRLAHSIDGSALWTAADLATDPLLDLGGAELHPAQQALVDRHGSQCGFCTPGFVMSLFALYQNRVATGQAVSREAAQADLSGNLCRCTGYRPILDAAQSMAGLPPARVDQAALLALLEQIAQPAQLPERAAGQEADHRAQDRPAGTPAAHYQAPTHLSALLQARARWPQARLVAGATDLGLSITQGLQAQDRLIDLTRVEELGRIERRPGWLAIGAAVTLEQAFAALLQEWPPLKDFAQRFAGLPVRQSGTLAGNIANGSPIGDSMPLLIALGAQLRLLRWDSTSQASAERRLALEDFYTGYRQSQLGADELIAAVEIPCPDRPAGSDWIRAYKVSKRVEDDISTVCLALSLQLEDGRVLAAAIGVGGVAATPMRARRTEALLIGQPWSAATVQQAMKTLAAEFEPLSDLRASADYRRLVLGRLLWRSWLESQGSALPYATRLQSLEPTALRIPKEVRP